jgi:hypothetical protein
MAIKVKKLKDDAVVKIEISKNFYDLIKASMYYVFTLEKDEAKKEEIIKKTITQDVYTPLNDYELTFKTLIHILAEIERVAAIEGLYEEKEILEHGDEGFVEPIQG